MQNPLIIALVLLIGAVAGAFLLLGPSSQQTGEDADQVDVIESAPDGQFPNAPAVINGEPVDESEIEFITQANIEMFRQLYGQLGDSYDEQLMGTMGEYKKLQHRGDALNDIIRERIQDAAVERFNIEVSQEAITERFRAEFEGLLNSFGVSETELVQFLEEPQNQEVFRQVLFQSGIMKLEYGDFDEFRTQVRENAARDLAREALRAEIVGDLNPTDMELLDFMEENREQFSHQAVKAVVPTEEEARAYFNANREQFPEGATFEAREDEVRSRLETSMRNEAFTEWLEEARANRAIPQTPEVNARHILISVSPDAPEEEVADAQSRIESIREQIVGGADFAEIANQTSEDPGTQGRQNGGDLGWFGLGRMVSPFEDAVFSLDINEISPIIRTQFGFHIAQVIDRRQSDVLRESALQAYKEQTTARQFETWLADQMDAANLVINDPLLRAYRIEQQLESITSYNVKLDVLDEAMAAYENALEELDNAQWVNYVLSVLTTEKIDLMNTRIESASDQSAPEIQALKREVEALKEAAVNRFLMAEYTAADAAAFDKMFTYASNNAELMFAHAVYLYEVQYDVIQAAQQIDALQNAHPNFKQDEVNELLTQIEEGEGIGPDGRPGRSVEILNAEHIVQGASHPPYNSNPPTSGWHYASLAPYGIHTEPIPDEFQIHNLEHGAVIIQYQPSIAQEMIDDMTDFVEELRTDQGFCRLMLAPYPDLDRPVALTAWGRILKMDVFDRPIALSFAGFFLDQGPEQVNDCQVDESSGSNEQSDEESLLSNFNSALNQPSFN